MILSQFIKFLENNKILYTALGVTIATSMTELITALNLILLDPVIAKTFNIDVEREVIILGAKVKIGALIVELINFFITLLVVFIIVRYVMRHRGPLPAPA